MKKKALITTFIFIILGIFCYNYSQNYAKSSKIPCNKWSKEVLLAEGAISEKPDIIKYKGYYYIAYNNGNILEIIKVDKLGKKLEKHIVKMKYKDFNDISLLISKNNISVNFTIQADKGLNVVILDLDKDMNIIKENVVKNISCKCKIGDNMLVMASKDVVEVRDLKENKIYKTKMIGKPSLIAANRYKDKNYIMYSVDGGFLAYFTLDKGVVSPIVNVGSVYEIIRVSYEGLALCVDDNYLCAVIEAMNMKEGSVFSIVNKVNLKTKEIEDYIPESLNINFSSQDITSSSEEGKIKFLVSATREYEKTEMRNDILEIYPDGEKSRYLEPVSRTKRLSFNPKACDNMVIFCDAINAEKGELYITSKDEAFKMKNNGPRSFEYVEAGIKTAESALYAILYLIPYGSLWIIPLMCLCCIFSMIEYKFKNRNRKIIFSCICILGAIAKVIIIHKKSFQQLAYYLPNGFSFVYGLIFCIVVSVLTSIYAYIKYTEDIDYKVMALSYFKAIGIDSFITLLLFVSFLK